MAPLHPLDDNNKANTLLNTKHDDGKIGSTDDNDHAEENMPKNQGYNDQLSSPTSSALHICKWVHKKQGYDSDENHITISKH